MEAINKKNAKHFNAAIKWLSKYNELNYMRDWAYNNDDEKIQKEFDKKCEAAWDKYLGYFDMLPKYEQKRIENSELY